MLRRVGRSVSLLFALAALPMAVVATPDVSFAQDTQAESWQRVGAKKGAISFEVPGDWTVGNVTRKQVILGAKHAHLTREERAYRAAGLDLVLNADKFIVKAPPNADGVSLAGVAVFVYAHQAPIVNSLADAKDWSSGDAPDNIVDSASLKLGGKHIFRVNVREYDADAGTTFFTAHLLFHQNDDLVSVQVLIDEVREPSAQALAEHIVGSIKKL